MFTACGIKHGRRCLSDPQGSEILHFSSYYENIALNDFNFLRTFFIWQIRVSYRRFQRAHVRELCLHFP